MNNRKDYFRRVLDICDELDSIKRRLHRRSGRNLPRTTQALVDEKNTKLKELSGQLDKAFIRGALGDVRAKYTLVREELLVIALLLSHRVRSGNSGVAGREILSTIFDSAYDIINGLTILSSDGSLRSSGIIVAPEPYREDVLEATFRLSDDMFYAIVYEIAGQTGIAVPRPPLRPFGSAREHLMEMGRLTALYRKRAAALFPLEAEDFFTSGGEVTLDEMDYRIEASWSDIEGRLLLTNEYEKYPLVRMERKYALSREELVIVTCLYFAELVATVPYIVVSDLVKLVSRDEEDLMTRRNILDSRSRLVSSGIVILDEEYSVHRKNATCDAYLADGVVEELTGPKPSLGDITADMQIDIHEFLKGGIGDNE